MWTSTGAYHNHTLAVRRRRQMCIGDSTGSSHATAQDGGIILLISGLLSYLTMRFVEEPLRAPQRLTRRGVVAHRVGPSEGRAGPVVARCGVQCHGVQ